MTHFVRFAGLAGAATLIVSLAGAEPARSAEPLMPVADATLAEATPTKPAALPVSEADKPLPVSALADSLPPRTDNASEPALAVGKGLSLSALVDKLRSTVPGSREMECLAGAIYFEAKSEPLAGQLAVGEVIANRAASGRFPRSYCGVVFQPGQFSFVRGRSMPAINRGHVQWKNAVAIARIVDDRLHKVTMPKALFFHATHVRPGWKLTRVGTLGNHVFYR